MSNNEKLILGEREVLSRPVGFGTYEVSLSESSRRDEIAYRHTFLLCGLCDFGGLFLRIIREDGFPYSVMQATTCEARAFTHPRNVSKSVAGKN